MGCHIVTVETYDPVVIIKTKTTRTFVLSSHQNYQLADVLKHHMCGLDWWISIWGFAGCWFNWEENSDPWSRVRAFINSKYRAEILARSLANFYCQFNKLTSVFCVCPVIDNVFRHNIVKVVCGSTRQNSSSITRQTHEKMKSIS